MKRITITFEEEMYEYLKDLAKNNRRQISKEINAILFDLKNNKNSLTVEQLQNAGITYLPKKKLITTPVLSKEEQELARLKLQQKKNDLREKRIDYFKKKYKEIYRGVLNAQPGSYHRPYVLLHLTTYY